jgi:hypothetical protein
LRLSRNGLLYSKAEKRHAREEREGYVSEHRRTLHCFVVGAPDSAFAHERIKIKTASVW